MDEGGHLLPVVTDQGVLELLEEGQIPFVLAEEGIQSLLDGLVGRVGVSSTPTLPVVDIAEAVTFYERAGFSVRVYTDESGDGGDGFAFVDYDGQSIFDLDGAPDMDPVANRADCYLVVLEADAWHAR